jgi:hypothetical protein
MQAGDTDQAREMLRLKKSMEQSEPGWAGIAVDILGVFTSSALTMHP